MTLWVNPNVELFGLDDVMPSNLNDRVSRDQAKIPNVRNWAVRDYGNRIGVWRLMEVLSRYGIRASAALNSEVCDHHPEIIEEGGKRQGAGYRAGGARRNVRRPIGYDKIADPMPSSSTTSIAILS